MAGPVLSPGNLELRSTHFVIGWAAFDRGSPSFVVARRRDRVLGVERADLIRKDLRPVGSGDPLMGAFIVQFDRPLLPDEAADVMVYRAQDTEPLPSSAPELTVANSPLQVFVLGAAYSGDEELGMSIASELGLPPTGQSGAAPLFAAASVGLNVIAGSKPFLSFMRAQDLSERITKLTRSTYYFIHSSASFVEQSEGIATVRAAPFLSRCFPESHFIHLSRNPVGSVVSRMAKAGGDFAEHCRTVADEALAWSAMKEELPHYLEVSWEEMAEFPGRVAKRIAAYLHRPDSYRVLETLLGRHRQGNASRLRPVLEDTEWSPRQRSLFRDICSVLPVHGTSPPAPVAIASGRHETSILLETDHVKVLADFRDSDIAVVTFNELGSTIAGDSYWGKRFFEKLGITCVGIMTPRPNWYPRRDMETAVAVINKALAGKRIITYGHSQGGYGALKFSRALGASVVLSFSPQFSIDPDEVGAVDVRFTRYHDRALEGGARIGPEDIGGRAMIVWDPLDPLDDWHVRRLTAYPGVTAVLLPFMGHDTVRLMADSGAGREVFALLRTRQTVTAATVRGVLRRNRYLSESYRRARLAHLVERLPGHEELMRRFVARTTSESALVSAICDLHAGRRTRLMEHLAQVSDTDLIICGILRLWTLFRAHGFAEGELKLADTIERCLDHDLFHLLHIVNTEINIGRHESAHERLMGLAGRFGADKHVEIMQAFADILGCSDELATILAEGDTGLRRIAAVPVSQDAA